MLAWYDITLLVLGASLLCVFALFAAGSLREREYRAAAVSAVLALVLAAPLTIAAFAPLPAKPLAAPITLALSGIALAAVLWPWKPNAPLRNDVPTARIDERDIMFARARLSEGSPEYEQYYALRPQNREVDDRIRKMPGLGSPAAALYHPLACRATDAGFDYIELVRRHADGPVAETRAEYPPEEITAFVKGVTCHYGAHSVGITELKDYHVYSHIGRGEGDYGAALEPEHLYAVAFTVEMDSQLIRTAPAASETMEVSKQYARAAQIALQLASLIRSLGYPARAHIDGNYRVVGPLVARDAGLGEIGRMGILMTPYLGPRVRLSFVTTDLPLLPDRRSNDPAVVELCRGCLKCAQNCPSNSIPFGDRQEINGAWRWKINSETCFSYWNHTGTDCGRCVAVCPYSHSDTFIHRPIRWGTRYSPFLRRIAPSLDDVFYGRHPRALPFPHWLDVAWGRG